MTSRNLLYLPVPFALCTEQTKVIFCVIVMSIASLEAKGVEEDAQKELLTRCGNCHWEFENETAKIAKINVNHI